MLCTYFNSGNYYHFKPNAIIYPPNNEPPIKAIDFYEQLVESNNRKDCFIVKAMPTSWHANKLDKKKIKK